MKDFIFVLGVFMTISSAQAADPAAGKQKALLVCSDCHGTNGVSVVENFPTLRGRRKCTSPSSLRRSGPARAKTTK